MSSHPSTPDPRGEARIAAVRRFTRFYTRWIGVLRRNPYGSALGLAEARVLYELAQQANRSAAGLARELDLDPGYLSRILRAFEQRGWIRRTRSPRDGRESVLELTAAGRKAFAPIDRASYDQVAGLLAHVPATAADAVVRDMAAIERALAPAAAAPRVTLRTHLPGDIGWIVERHGALYAREYGWDARFEALVAQIGARFLERFDPARERCWIAERDGERVGCVMVVRRTRATAQLRLLLVEPSARGLGVGKRLVDECIAFAKTAGYRRMMLWTNAGLDAARGIYDARGFELVAEEAHHSFGHALVGQTLERAL
jgi:DNA-binding MarR family transcriptional regulator/N-acetylglutamate synthase-like GNAT family acetyltransferase